MANSHDTYCVVCNHLRKLHDRDVPGIGPVCQFCSCDAQNLTETFEAVATAWMQNMGAPPGMPMVNLLPPNGNNVVQTLHGFLDMEETPRDIAFSKIYNAACEYGVTNDHTLGLIDEVLNSIAPAIPESEPTDDGIIFDELVDFDDWTETMLEWATTDHVVEEDLPDAD